MVKSLKRSISRVGLAAAVVGIADAAFAASINVDIGTFGTGVPSTSYGAASGQSGTWNGILDRLPTALLDTSGAATGATLELANLSTSGLGDNTSLSGDDQALLDDLGRIGFGDVVGDSATMTVSGLGAGTYDVYTYAWDASFADRKSTRVDVNGVGDQLVAPSSNIFMGFEPGVTHSLHTVTIRTGEDLTITVTTASDMLDQGVANGFQLVRVAEPSTSALRIAGLVCIGLCTGWRTRWRARTDR